MKLKLSFKDEFVVPGRVSSTPEVERTYWGNTYITRFTFIVPKSSLHQFHKVKVYAPSGESTEPIEFNVNSYDTGYTKRATPCESVAFIGDWLIASGVIKVSYQGADGEKLTVQLEGHFEGNAIMQDAPARLKSIEL